MPLLCPACRKVAMQPHTDRVTGLEIDACQQCDGMWFDAHELSRFLQSPELRDRFLWTDATEPFAAVGYVINTSARKCPRCRVVMDEKVYGGVTLDVCGQCQGIWFDDGEVRTIVERYKTGTSGDKAVLAELTEGFHESGGKQSGVLQTLLNFVHQLGHHAK